MFPHHIAALPIAAEISSNHDIESLSNLDKKSLRKQLSRQIEVSQHLLNVCINMPESRSTYYICYVDQETEFAALDDDADSSRFSPTSRFFQPFRMISNIKTHFFIFTPKDPTHYGEFHLDGKQYKIFHLFSSNLQMA